MTCVECGAELPAPARTGRPRRYCDQTCRRLAEHRIARLRRCIERLERDLLQESVSQAKAWAVGPRDEKVLKLLEAERKKAEAKLRELIQASLPLRSDGSDVDEY